MLGIEPCAVGTADIGGSEDLTTHVSVGDADKSIGLMCGADATEHLLGVLDSIVSANSTNDTMLTYAKV